MDQPKPNPNPSSIAQTNLQNINSPALQFIMSLMRSKLLQNSSIQSNQSSSSTTQKQTQKLNFGSSSEPSTASSPLSPSLQSSDSTSSSFLLSTKQFQSPQASSSLSQLNLSSLVNFNLSLASSAVLSATPSFNKRSKNNSQSKSNSNKGHISSSSSEPSTEIESISTSVKTKKKKSAFKFDNRKYVRRSFTPMGELLQPIKVPTLEEIPSSIESDSTMKHSYSFVLSEDEFKNSVDNFDIVKSHQILELYEARIQMGHDDIHLHPALAIKAADEKNSTVFSQEEIKRFDNYDQINVYQPRPNFWPPRPWDIQNDAREDTSIQSGQNNIDEKTTSHTDFSKRPTELTDQESEKLLKMIEDSYKIPEIEVTYSTKSSKTQKKKRPHRTLSSSSSTSRFSGIKNLRNQKSYTNMSSTIINLYAINMVTDDSDLDTDLEDF